MRKLLSACVIALFVAPVHAQQATSKRPITHDVYDGWKSIQGTKVSRDGLWVAYALVPQDGLYTIAILDAESSFRVIGSVKEVLVAPESPGAVLDRMVAPTTYIVSATITEKGYCLNKEGGLDFSHPDIAYDLKHPETPKTFVGFLARALRLRHDKGHEPFNVISCDNLADNGHRLRRAVTTTCGGPLGPPPTLGFASLRASPPPPRRLRLRGAEPGGRRFRTLRHRDRT